MQITRSRLLLRACIVLFLVQAALVDAKKKKLEEETPPDPVGEEIASDPSLSTRDERDSQTTEVTEDDGSLLGQTMEAKEEGGEGSERTKKSYCAGSRYQDGGYGGQGYPPGPSPLSESGPYPHHTPYARSDDHSYNEMSGYHGGAHGHDPHGSSYSGHDTPDYHGSPTHYKEEYGGAHHGYGGDKGHPSAAYNRKPPGDYYGGHGGHGKGSDQYHSAAHASASAYHPSPYQQPHDSYGGPEHQVPYGSPSNAYHAQPYGAPSSKDYAPHPAAPSSSYSGSYMKPAYGSHVYGAVPYAPVASYAPAASYIPAATYVPAASYAAVPYAPAASPYHAPAAYAAAPAPYGAQPILHPYAPSSYHSTYPLPGYPHPSAPVYPYGSAYPPYGTHHGVPIPVTLTCSLQPQTPPHHAPESHYDSPGSYRANEDSSKAGSGKAPLSMVVIPGNHTKTEKPGEKTEVHGHKETPSDSHTTHRPQHEHGKGDAKGTSTRQMEEMGSDKGVEMGQQGPSRKQRMPFSMLRQRQLESQLHIKPVFYQQEY